MGKVKDNAQGTADTGPETGAETGENGGGTPPASAAVEQPGAESAGAAGAQQPEGDAVPSGVSGQPAGEGVVSGDDEGTIRSENAGVDAVGEAVVSAETAAGAAGDDVAEGAAEGAALAAGSADGTGEADGDGATAAAAAVTEGQGNDQSHEKNGAAVASGEAGAETGAAADPDAQTPTPSVEDPFALMVRVGHALVSFVHAEAENLCECLGQEPIKTSYGEWEDAVPGLVGLICSIGKAATADVLAAQMKIDGHRETASISATERVALDAMAMTVRRLHEIVLVANAVQPGPAVNAAPLRPEDSTYESADAPGDLVA